MTKTIEVIVSPRGETTVQTRGFTGPACLEAARRLEQSLGVITTEQKTAEFYGTAEVDQQLHQ